MKFTIFLKKIITFIISFILVTQYTVNAATGINIENRTVETSFNITKSSTPSDLPVIGFSNFFDKEKINLIENLNLADYIGKKVFVGYGVYDKNEDNCKFLEQPGVTKNDYDSTFTIMRTNNQHTYAISKTRMNYNECLSLGDRFGGYPLIVDSASENYFVNSEFTKKTLNNVLIEKIWLGAKKSTCTDNYYTNEKGNPQYFEKFVDDYTKSTCTTDKMNLKQNKDGFFEKTNSEVPAYCVLEFDTEDIYKPLKVCASWWKIEREYPLNTGEDFYKTNLLKRVNQADIPIQLVVCNKYNEDAVEKMDLTSIRTAHCTEYYSATVAPECLTDMFQPQCKVSECNGYIQNACRLKDSKTVGKGYVKGEVLINGTLTETKIKDKIITNEYECPAATISNKYCEEESTVVIYPQECPLSQCSELKECVLAAGTSSSALSTCYETYKCTKIYGGRDIPPVIVNGEVTHLKGKCPDAPESDGSVLEFPVNIQNKLTKKCLEYEILESTELVNQKCKLERPYIDYVVDTSITAVDNYQDDPNCLRMDTSEESQIEKNLVFKVTNKNYFKNLITKVYLDDTIETIYNGGSDNYLLYSAMPQLAEGAVTSPQVTVDKINIGSSSNLAGESGTNTTINESSFIDCSLYDPALSSTGEPTNPWYNRNINLFTDSIDASGVATFDPNLSILDTSGSYATVSVSDSVINSQTDCANYASLHGITSYINYTYSKNTTTGVDYCTLNLNKFTTDVELNQITRIGTDSLRYSFRTNMSGENCLKKAYCLDGVYNESNFSSMQSINACVVTTGDGSPASYEQYISNLVLGTVDTPTNENFTGSTKEMCTPSKTTANASATIDGIENIVIFEDYATGGFGFYSNNNSWKALSNEILISADSFTEKRLIIPEMSYITDFISYHGIYKHESWKAKKPNVPASLIGGAVAGLAAWAGGTSTIALYAALSPLAIGLIVVVVIVVLLILLGRSSSMDRQYTEYHVFKDIPKPFYFKGLYETRTTGDAAYVSGEQSPHNSIHSDFIRMTYWHVKSDTGRQKPGPFLDTLKMLFKNKKANMVCGGIEESEVMKATHPDELSINYGYPKCKWYKPWCEKHDDYYAELISNSPMLDENIEVPLIQKARSSSKVTNIEKLRKDVSTVYLGAVNTMVVLVPFKGDYKLEAFNKHGDLLSSRTIHEDSFAGVADANAIEYAQVNFGLSMNLADGMEDALSTKACRKDRAVEWGGGVSGVFVEANRTDVSNACTKSNDEYLKDNSMTKITVQPLNMDRKFTYELVKPMPFANRVFLASLNSKEIRNYRCYQDFTECEDGNYIQEAAQ